LNFKTKQLRWFGIDIKSKVGLFLQLFNKSMLRNGTKTFLEPKFFSISDL